MSVSGIENTGNGNVMQSGSNSQPKTSAEIISDFLTYMKETPAQRMEDSWLSAHGISKQAFDAMSPEQKAKIIAQMKQDIEREVKDKMDQTAKKQDAAIAP